MAAVGKIGDKLATIVASTQYRDGRPVQTTLLIALTGSEHRDHPRGRPRSRATHSDLRERGIALGPCRKSILRRMAEQRLRPGERMSDEICSSCAVLKKLRGNPHASALACTVVERWPELRAKFGSVDGVSVKQACKFFGPVGYDGLPLRSRARRVRVASWQRRSPGSRATAR